MSTRIGLIPGIIRKEFPDDRASMLSAIAKLGFQGVEWGLPKDEADAGEMKKITESYGLKFVSGGVDKKSLGSDIDSIVRRAVATGCGGVVNFYSPCDSRDAVLGDAELYNKVGPVCKDAGLKFCYHNHDHEFKNVFDGKRAIDILLENTEPGSVYLEVDVAWVAYGGEDPVSFIRKHHDRIGIIHLKDIADINVRAKFTAIGTGIVDVRGVMKAANEIGLEWAIVEQDGPNRLTPMESVTASILNLKEWGIVPA